VGKRAQLARALTSRPRDDSITYFAGNWGRSHVRHPDTGRARRHSFIRWRLSPALSDIELQGTPEAGWPHRRSGKRQRAPLPHADARGACGVVLPTTPRASSHGDGGCCPRFSILC